jgi:bacillithiol biosynthesis deacetylase BshB1
VDVLAIAAHPDDAEVTCGGLLIRMADLGYRTGVLDLTRGEMGTRGSPEIREQEASVAASAMGLAARVNAGLPDGRLELNDASREAVACHIRRLRPSLVILPSAGQRHPDHNAASEIGYAGIFAAGLAQFPVEGAAHRPEKILYAASDYGQAPTFYVDIASQMDRKLAAASAYESQFGKEASGIDGGPDVRSRIIALARYHGVRAGVAYAEGYRINEALRLEDPLRELRLKSI